MKTRQTHSAHSDFLMNYSQKITLKATITINLNVPELKSGKQLNQWIKSDAARIHLIDHLKPTSFDSIQIIKVSKDANKIY